MPVITMQFPSSISVANLNGVNGFAITGFPAGGWGGFSVSGAGDVNGDGIVDLIIGAPYASSNTGISYVLFGQSGIGNSGTVSVSSLTGSNGFAITGFSANSFGGQSVSGAGDVNGDGIADLIIGAPLLSSSIGASYVLFGQSGIGSSGSASISSLNGSNGFVITGFPGYGGGGWSVSGAGDVNDDGITDLIIGANGANSGDGAVYVLFGQSGIGSSGSVSVSALTGSNGFAITGFPTNSNGGGSVSGAGDVNGDGIADLIIGAPNGTGMCYVLFGQSGIGSSGSVSVSSLTGSNGFAITGFSVNSGGGYSVSGAGDVNDDGIADLIVGAPYASSNGGSYVLFGQSGIGSSGSVSVSSLTGSNGFVITGFPAGGSEGGWSVSGAGDVNGDGIADLIIGAPNASSHAGITYVLFGQSGIGNSGSVSVSSLTGSNGFAIKGFSAGGEGGWSVSGAGDVNGDGIADLIIGATGASSGAGGSYVLFGESTPLVFLSRNQLTIKEDQTLALNSQNLNVTNPKNPSKDPTFQFTISDIKHARFYSSSNPNISLTHFVQQQIRNGQIYFAHDGSGWAPSCNMSVSYSSLFAVTPFQVPAITFQQSFTLVNNTLTINQGQTLILTLSNLSANDLYNSANNPNLVFSLSHVQYGYFSLTSAPTTPITSFTQSQIQNGKVQFVHDGSTNPPTYNVAVMNGAASITAQAATISFDAIPVFINNNLTINQGQTVVLSSSDLSATNPYDSGASLTFTISNVQYGYFALTNAPTTPIINFTQAQIQAGIVQFVQDGSANTPSYSLTVSDGRTTSTAQASTVSFDAIPTFSANTLTINQGQTVVLSSSNLNALDAYAVSSITYTVSDVQHGYFALTSAPTTSITSFTQAQIQSGAVQFVQDGSINAPSFNVTATDGRAVSLTQIATISFDAIPILTANTLTINQGQTVILTASNLNAINPYNSKASLTFTVSQVQNGHFELVNNPGAPVTSFTQVQVNGSQVKFVSDGTANSPSYSVLVGDGRLSSQTQVSTISFDVPPVIDKNSITVTQGQTITLTNNDINATDPYDTSADITFTVSNVQNGQFELVSNPGTSITSFTQAQIDGGQIQFVQDGSSAAPGYVLSVSDGRMTGVAGAGASTVGLVNFTPTPQLVSGGSSETIVRNEIIGGSVSGGVGLLFLIMKLYITRKATQSLQNAIEGGSSDVEKQQAAHYREVVRPIANKVFEKINTTGFLGYRSEQNAKGYIEAIQKIIANLEKLGVSLDFKSMSASQRDLLINEIAKQTKQVAGKKYRCCTTDYVCRFFKVEVTPQELDSKAGEIANAVYRALNTSVVVRPLSSPVADDVKLASVELNEMGSFAKAIQSP